MTDTTKGPRMSCSFRRPLALAVVPVAAALVLLGLSSVDSAGAAALGTVDVSPSPGTDTSSITLTTSGGCPAGTATAVQARVEGSGFPAAGQQITSVTPIDALSTTSSGGYILPVSQTLADYAKLQSPAVVYSGAYTITVKCRTNTRTASLGDFTGTLTFSSPSAYTQTSATASPTPSASGSASPSASASPSSSTSPSSSSSPVAPGSATPSASPSVTKSPIASPTVSSPAPSQTGGGATLMATDATGSPLQANPVLTTVQAITVTASGFQANEPVAISVQPGGQRLGTAMASGGGVVRYLFTVPSNLGAGGHTLTLSGSLHTSLFAFRVGASSKPAVTSSGSTGTGTGAGTSSGPLPFTGSNTVRLLLLGLTLIWGGAMLIMFMGPGSSGVPRHAAPNKRGRHSR